MKYDIPHGFFQQPMQLENNTQNHNPHQNPSRLVPIRGLTDRMRLKGNAESASAAKRARFHVTSWQNRLLFLVCSIIVVRYLVVSALSRIDGEEEPTREFTNTSDNNKEISSGSSAVGVEVNLTGMEQVEKQKTIEKSTFDTDPPPKKKKKKISLPDRFRRLIKSETEDFVVRLRRRELMREFSTARQGYTKHLSASSGKSDDDSALTDEEKDQVVDRELDHYPFMSADTVGLHAPRQPVENPNSSFPSLPSGPIFDERDYSKPFVHVHKDFKSWRYREIWNRSVTEHVFDIGRDQITTLKPMCMNTESGEVVTFTDGVVCSGLNQSEKRLDARCSFLSSVATRDHWMAMSEQGYNSTIWMKKHGNDIHWVEGVTVIQMWDHSCKNIAHYTGRLMALFHTLQNVAAYTKRPRTPSQVLVFPGDAVLPLFEERAGGLDQRGEYHRSLFEAATKPYVSKVGTMGDVIHSSRFGNADKTTVMFLRNTSLKTSLSGWKRTVDLTGRKHVCFRQAVIPSFFRGRFFVHDVEVPSTLNSVQPVIRGDGHNVPFVPRDSVTWRRRLHAVYDGRYLIETPVRRVVFINRRKGRRAFDKEGHENVLDRLWAVAGEKGFKLEVVDFEGKSFKQQFETIKTAAVAIGIHGANLVNVMMMAPLTTLVEIFPFGFSHDMYINGGNAGVRYLNHEMKSGKRFEGGEKYQTVKMCVRLNPACKRFYRDTTLKVTGEDVNKIGELLKQAISWAEKLPLDDDHDVDGGEEEVGR